jgi:hypothetical protein
MNIADLLCSPVPTEEEEEEKHRAPPPVEQCAVAPVEPPSVGSPSSKAKRAQVVTKKKCRSFAVLPDKQRKRQYYMSKTQKQRRRDHEAFESRVFNLTLDVNALKQEVKRLMEIRDLQVTQLLLSRHRLENDLLNGTESMVRSLRQDRSGPTDCQFLRTAGAAGGLAGSSKVDCRSMFEFEVRLDQIKTSCTVTRLHVRAFVQEDEDPDDEIAEEVLQVCGPGGGCLVEVEGIFETCFPRALVLIMFPHAAGDEMLMSRLAGLWLPVHGRLLLYFNAQRQLVRQIAQSDLIPALHKARPREVATLMSSPYSQFA